MRASVEHCAPLLAAAFTCMVYETIYITAAGVVDLGSHAKEKTFHFGRLGSTLGCLWANRISLKIRIELRANMPGAGMRMMVLCLTVSCF